MAKTLISRLDAENIVRAAVDPETHEATGDVYDSVNDVSYPFGGEGEGLKNPLLTITLAGIEDGQPIHPFIMENGYLFTDDRTATEDGDYTTYVLGFTEEGATIYAHYEEYVPIATFSDLVNCTVDNELSYIIITDPTQPASITATFNNK